jgi:hypothetical protein
LGEVPNYVEPFAGSLAVLLGRPSLSGIETVNVWRALALAPAETARWAAWPVNECDLHARHLWLRARRESLSARLMADPEYYDAKIAGWWLWGIACWIGSGWCGPGGAGPWGVRDGELVHLGDAGQGVARKRVHLGTAGHGVTRQSVADGEELRAYFARLQARLLRVRVCCGDWRRVVGDAATVTHGLTGLFFDPPYGEDAQRTATLYAEDSLTVAREVQAWCLAHGQDARLRIVLCGYAGEHEALDAAGWQCYPWKASAGYSRPTNGPGVMNAERERLWASPACLRPAMGQLPLFPSLMREVLP